jgi:hypothetical protein
VTTIMMDSRRISSYDLINTLFSAVEKLTVVHGTSLMDCCEIPIVDRSISGELLHVKRSLLRSAVLYDLYVSRRL